MSKDTWDAILASAPLNETAGRAVSKGIHYEPAAGVVNARQRGAHLVPQRP